MYSFRLYTTALDQAGRAADVSSSCDGCGICPDNRSTCLWVATTTQWSDDGTATNCEAGCTVGCVRQEDCNRCNDRRCDVCTNFDAEAASCTT
ncbi:MAG: hypothetical protein V2I33_19295 [Kangiellaceae bacterium]|nr:hypothetical protein [Kangiellaceae bacterium]